jgi:hypothetical protein
MFPIPETPRIQKISRLETFENLNLSPWSPKGKKMEKIFVSNFDDFGVNHLLSSSPTTFTMALGV